MSQVNNDVNVKEAMLQQDSRELNLVRAEMKREGQKDVVSRASRSHGTRSGVGIK